MAKRDVDQKVKKALDALLAEKETAVRSFAEILDRIETTDQEIATLIDGRNALLQEAGAAQSAAREAGWKPRELTDAGLVVPKPMAGGTPATSGGSKSRADISFPPHGDGAGGASGAAGVAS